MRADVTVVGGGLIGLATAWQLARRRPGLALAVLEKERRPAAHQSGRNSGVLHTGVFYVPGSSKARLCRDGKRAMERFCDEQALPRAQRGKVIVAVEERELPRLDALLARGRANGVACERVSAGRLSEIEPYARGLAALHVPGAGSVDYALVAARLSELPEAGGQETRFCPCVPGVRPSGARAVVETHQGALETRLVVCCAGPHSAPLPRASGAAPDAR